MLINQIYQILQKFNRKFGHAEKVLEKKRGKGGRKEGIIVKCLLLK